MSHRAEAVRRGGSGARRLRHALASIVAAAAAAFALAPAGAAWASDIPRPVEISASEPATVAIEYGQQWFFDFTVSEYPGCYSYCNVIFTDDTTGEGLGSTTILSPTSNRTNADLAYVASYMGKPLAAGDHEISAYFKVADQVYVWEGTTRTPATLQISPAALGVDLMVTADPINSSNALINARLTGRFVDEIAPPEWRSENDPVLPAGTWSVTVSDASGTAQFTRQVPVEQGSRGSISMLWQDVPRGEDFTTAATFTPSDSTADSFAISAFSGGFFTSPAAAVAPSDPAPAQPEEAAAPASTDPVVPVWALILAGIVASASIAVIIWSLLRRRRSGAEPTSEDPGSKPHETAEAPTRNEETVDAR